LAPSDSGSHEHPEDWTAIRAKVKNISEAISEGANAFLFKEYQVSSSFATECVPMAFTILPLISTNLSTNDVTQSN
jgi:Na+/H+-translocating membrane pyrophosphatase